MPAVVEIRIADNADWRRGFVFEDAAGTPIDWTGSTFAMGIKTSSAAADPPAYTLTTANGGITVADPTSGRIEIFIPKGSVTVGEYVFDLIRIALGERERLWRGPLFVVKGITP